MSCAEGGEHEIWTVIPQVNIPVQHNSNQVEKYSY